MVKQSAGILVFKKSGKSIEVLLVHPGGPFWAKKDAGAWSIPKGEFADDEDSLEAAKREFLEELGERAPEDGYVYLGAVKQSSGKVVHAWTIEADFDPKRLKSNAFEMEWPPKSGKKQQFPEVDKAAWFPLDTAETKLVKGQLPLFKLLGDRLGLDSTGDEPGEIPSQVSLF